MIDVIKNLINKAGNKWEMERRRSGGNQNTEKGK